MDEKEIKITDKRMFTADGELREEYRSLLDAKPDPPASAAQPAPPPPEPPPAAPAGGRAEEWPGGERDAVPIEIPTSPGGYGAPTFFDLVATLAEPVSLYLGDIDLGDGQVAENLEMAHLHIDLLDVVRQKTVGNLTAQEAAFLEDLLYRLRLRYVQKRG